MAITPVPWLLPMGPRDPHEPHRVATPLELFFDLIFVVAIAAAAAQLHHGVSGGHLDAYLGFVMSFVAIWWAWMGYTWYASAYECDDAVYRSLTFVIMAGSLVFAAAIPDLFADGQSMLAVAGYSIMRMGLVPLWLRAARNDPPRRQAALTYAIGISLVQLFWIARLWEPAEWNIATFFIGMALELSIPWFAERRGHTPFHPHHIAERYSLLVIIALGEVVLSSVQAVGGALPSGQGEPDGDPVQLMVLSFGGLLIVFGLWWLYFKSDQVALFAGERSVWIAGYGHLPVFASVAATGAALAAAVDVVQGESAASPRTVAFCLAGPIALYCLLLVGLHIAQVRSVATLAPAGLTASGVLVVAWLAPSIATAVLGIGLVVTAAVFHHVATSNRPNPTHRLL